MRIVRRFDPDPEALERVVEILHELLMEAAGYGFMEKLDIPRFRSPGTFEPRLKRPMVESRL
jgi:hypothetical protein